MKKSSMQSLVSFLNSVSDLPSDVAAVRDELNAECAKDAQKSADRRSAYDATRDIVLSVVSDTPQTVKEVYAACADNLPNDFTANKIQYAFLHYWTDSVRKIENVKGANTYVRA